MLLRLAEHNDGHKSGNYRAEALLQIRTCWSNLRVIVFLETVNHLHLFFMQQK